ncbi:ribbon-helix-helix protein, CopG family [Nostoc sp. JL33]|nr:ribbon-helix-helix protein, CopG family [Nostoc sp. JL33]MBN3872289.1 ribbon-helix-helix protein, CopG family [Nostoc sp. JL33]
MTRTATVKFRATEQEVAKIEELAKAAGYSKSEYVRLVAMGFQIQPQDTK